MGTELQNQRSWLSHRSQPHRSYTQIARAAAPEINDELVSLTGGIGISQIAKFWSGCSNKVTRQEASIGRLSRNSCLRRICRHTCSACWNCASAVLRLR